MAITLTSKAATRVRAMLDARGAVALRLGIKPTGCSGNGYVVDYAQGIGPEDEVFESQGVRIVVERKNMVFLDGTEIDYGRNGLSESLRFNNPNEKARCGCGESFAV